MSEYSDTTIPQELLSELLRKNNPFASDFAPSDPWSNNLPDVVSINRQAFDGIRTLIERKATDPQMPLAGMILGEAGMGKTHLLRRILDACKESESPSLFVFVKPEFDSKQALHHLLQEIVLCLTKKSDGAGSFSQFERLVAEIIRDYVRFHVTNRPEDATPANQRFLEQFEANVFHIFDIEKVRAGTMEEIISDKVSAGSMGIIEKNAISYIHLKVPETTKRFLDVVFQYKTPEKRVYVCDWLKGEILDEDSCEILGVPSRANLSDEAREQEAGKIILTLGALFTRYQLPMVICFDQLENFTQSQLSGFARMIHLLVNDATSMLPLSFMRWEAWYERLRKQHSDKAFTDRMESNVFLLSHCNPSEAKELVSSRVEQMFGKESVETIAIEKWLIPLLGSKLSGSNSPREVINLAKRVIMEASGDSKPELLTVSESITAEYKSAFEAVAADYDAWDPDSEYLKRAAELYLTNRENVLTCVPGDGKYMTWTGTLKPLDDAPNGEVIPFACFINTAKHWQRVSASLDQCKTFLQKHPGGICTYITDARCDFKPTWDATNKKRNEFESLGGNVVILDQPAAVRWYGLVSLSWKIGSGDILLEDSHGLRTATDKDLAGFLKTDFPAHDTHGTFDQITKKKVGSPVKKTTDVSPPPPENLIPAILDILAECTFPVQKMDVVMEKLREKGINITLESCLEQIGKNQNVVNLLPSRDGFMVKRAV